MIIGLFLLALLSSDPAVRAAEISVLYADPMINCTEKQQPPCPASFWIQRQSLAHADRLTRDDFVQIIVIYDMGRRIDHVYGFDHYWLLVRDDEYMLGGWDDRYTWRKPGVKEVGRKVGLPGFPPKDALVFGTENAMLTQEDWERCLRILDTVLLP